MGIVNPDLNWSLDEESDAAAHSSDSIGELIGAVESVHPKKGKPLNRCPLPRCCP